MNLLSGKFASKFPYFSQFQAKHMKVNGLSRSEYLTSVLESLTPDDVRHLVTAEDEMHRAGK